jgi:putative flippase GtrA
MIRLLRELGGYVGASAIALGLDICLLALLVSGLGVPYLAAAASSFLAGTLFVYWASVKHVFGYRRLESAGNEFAVFLAIGVVGLTVNLAAMYMGVSKLGLHYLLAKVLAAGFTFLANFAMRRWLLFTPWGSACAHPSRRKES